MELHDRRQRRAARVAALAFVFEQLDQAGDGVGKFGELLQRLHARPVIAPLQHAQQLVHIGSLSAPAAAQHGQRNQQPRQ